MRHKITPVNQQAAGFPCPNCQFWVEVSVQSLLYGDKHVCPSCHTEFKMDRDKSRDALKMVQKLQVALENMERSREFKR